MNHDAIEIRFGNAEAAAIEAEEIRFDPPVAPDVAAQVDASLEVAIGEQVLKAQVIAALIESFLEEFTERYEIIAAMRFEQRRARAETYREPT
jgi:hypothetical protein